MEGGKHDGLPMRVITHKHPLVSFFPLSDSPQIILGLPGPVLSSIVSWAYFSHRKLMIMLVVQEEKQKDSNCLYLLQHQ